MTSIETVEDKANKDIEYVTQDTLSLPSQQYGKANETIDAKLWIRNIETTLEKFSWDWRDWDVVISVDTTLSRDMYYNNLTVTGTLNTTGYKVFVKNLLQVTETGVIQANGNNWGNAWNGTNAIVQTNPNPQWLWGTGWVWGTATASGTISGTIAWVSWWDGNRWTTFWDTTSYLVGNGWNNGTAVTHSLLTLSGNLWWVGWYRGGWPWASAGAWSTVTQIKQNITDALLARDMYWFDWTNISLYKSGWVWGWGSWWGGWIWGASSGNEAGGWWGWWGWSWASWWIVRIRAKQIINNWYIQANWGNWGNGWNGWSLLSWFANWWCWGWWGAGWNWWYILLVCRVYQWDWVNEANWGTGWIAWTTYASYSAASNGSNGAIWEIFRITL